jgi:Ni/Fe-hydrogenase subunit HybB-like protein
MAHAQAEPIGGPLLTKGFRFMLGALGVWVLLLIWRYAVGIGAVSGLTDGYPWGVWIAFDVVTGTALACGGYAIAILCYIFNRGQYHPLVRPAILTSALGYSLAGLAIAIDVGRPWLIHNIPIRVFDWNLNSALLEVALCVMAYIVVLWIELSPAFFERWKETSTGALKTIAENGIKILDKLLIFIIALGILLPTMHQSSLGTVMLLAGHKLHGLWYTGWIPLLFLISCIGMGYGIVVCESTVSSRVFKREREDSILVKLSGAIVFVLAAFLILRFADIIISGKAGLMFSDGLYSIMFWIEMVLFALPIVMLAGKGKESFKNMLRAGLIIIFAGALYRFDAYIVAYDPGPGWSYFPSLPELLITLGVITLEIVVYVYVVKRFPIIAGKPAQ